MLIPQSPVYTGDFSGAAVVGCGDRGVTVFTGQTDSSLGRGGGSLETEGKSRSDRKRGEWG